MSRDRSGPPTPRNEPWRMPTPSLGAQPGRIATPLGVQGVDVCASKAMTSAEAAFATWASKGHRERGLAKAVFLAGWNAAIVNQGKEIAREPIDIMGQREQNR